MEDDFCNINQKLIMQSLEWTYAKAVNGALGLDSAEELARNFFQKYL